MHTAATEGTVLSDGSGRSAFEQSAATFPGVSAPSSVVRSITRTASSSAHSFASFLIERFPSVAARSSSATASTEPIRGSRGSSGSSKPRGRTGAFAIAPGLDPAAVRLALRPVRRAACSLLAPALLALFAAAGCASSAPPNLPDAAFGQVDVSSAPGPQEEVSAAIDPSDDRILAAGSNEGDGNAMRFYQSTDGGARWSSALSPRLGLARSWCAYGDPSLGIDSDGREYYAFLAAPFPCRTEGRGQVYVATRLRPGSTWTSPTAPIAPPGVAQNDDKPALAVDLDPASPHRGRVYVVWARQFGPDDRRLLVSHSDDHGGTWSAPARVSGVPAFPINSSVAVGGDGTVYVAWDDVLQEKILVDRSAGGTGAFGPDREGAPYLVAVTSAGCGRRVLLPAPPTRCVGPRTTGVVDRSRRRDDGPR